MTPLSTAARETASPTRARRTREEQRAVTRATLLDAAARVFADRGFHGATVDQVAEAAGLTKGAVYSNFESKEDLFLSVLEDRLDPYLRDSSPALGDSTGASEPVEAVGRAYADLLDDGRTWLLLKTEFWLHAMRNPDVRFKLAARHRVVRDRVADLVDQHMGALGLALDLPGTETAAAILALSDGLALQQLIDRTALPDDLFPRVLAALLRSLAGADGHPSDGTAGTDD